MNNIKGMNELKDELPKIFQRNVEGETAIEDKNEWKSDNPDGEDPLEGTGLITEEEIRRRMADAQMGGATLRWDGRAVEAVEAKGVDIADISDEAGVKLSLENDSRDKIRFEDGDIGLERMADEVHQVWCRWMEYQFSKGLVLENRGFAINPIEFARWRRQMVTPYAELSEDEKQSDRDIARRYLNIAWGPEKEG